MDDYALIDKECENLNKWVKAQKEDLLLIKEKMKVFKTHLLSLQKDINKIDYIPNGYFGFLNLLMENFGKKITDDLFQFEDLIISPLDNFLYSFNFATSKNINMLKDIQKDLIEEKQELNNKKDVYFNYIINQEDTNEKNKSKNIFLKLLKGGNTEDASKKKDLNIFNKSVEDDYEQLYQYGLDKMNEVIDENNVKYNNIYTQINAIFASFNLTVKESLIKFSNMLSAVSLNFSTLSKEILTKIDSMKVLNTVEISQSINKMTKSKNEPRFSKEKKETKIINTEPKKSTKKKLKLFSSNNDSNKNIGEIINTNNNSEDKKEENNAFVDRIIYKIFSKDELKYREISELINIFNILSINNNEDSPYINFLNHIKLYYNNRVISLKNKNNFFHLSNIMNHLFTKYKENNTVVNLVIDIAQKIKYENNYLYKIIRKKNEFFVTKTLWLQLIEKNLINDIDTYTNNLLDKKSEENINTNSNPSLNQNSIVNDEECEKNFLKKKINNYKLLNKAQKKDLIIFAKQKICFILSKTIGQMCDFQVEEIIISEILRNFDDIFKFDYNMKYYFKMKMIVIKNMKLKNQKKYFSNKEQILNNKLILISNTSKFFPIQKYSTFLKLNKSLYPKLKKKIFLNLFSEFNLQIPSQMQLLQNILEINKIRNKYNYEKIKIEVIKKGENKDTNNTIFLIEKDLMRTGFIRENKEHFEKIKNILVCFDNIFPKIGYCQGMNYIIAFLYQLLGQNEELTFYFLCGLLLNTKYHQIFEDDFESLNLFFKIFEKILEINRPEIYYKFIDNNVVTSSYISPLFITLFTDHAPTFNENTPPKFIFFIFEKFILEGWSSLFNCGFTLLEFTYEKIMDLEKDELISFIMNISSVITKEENFEKTKNIFNKNSYFIDEFFVEKLIEITKMEKNNTYLDVNNN